VSVAAPASQRRQFPLPEEDTLALDAIGLPWETVVEGGTQWLVIRDWPLPPGYSESSVSLAVRIVPGYPTAALDMIYAHPPIRRKDGSAIAAVSDCQVDGRIFQQWSRHYTPQNPWRADVDSVMTHLHAAEEWFRRSAG
jgi:hypothetical protein